MRKLYDLEKEKICWRPWMISGVGIWTGLVAMGLLLFAVACSEGTRRRTAIRRSDFV